MDAPAGPPPVVDPPAPEAARGAGVPPVVAVVVTHDAGGWLEETLAAVGAQDYPNLSVLVVDAASAVDPTPRIAATLPGAYVRRLESNDGFGAAANDVLGVVEGASHYVFLHDDAAPYPDAVRLLVEEAFRSNAGVVSPKLVDWDDPRRLLAVGAAADRTGVVTPYGRHDLDQEQHDAVRDVFAAPGGATLVRADLFETLGGFDAGLALFGEDLDLCWRAHVLGARVVVAPAARVRHREATVAGERPLDVGGATTPEGADRLQLRHRLRSVLKAYGPLYLLLVLPRLVLVMLAEAALAVVSGRPRSVLVMVDAWRWNLERRSELRAARRHLSARRALRDREVRRLQSSGGSRLGSALRTGLAAEERAFGMGAASRRVAEVVTAGGARQNLIVWLSLAVVLVVGSRELLGGKLPAVGQLVPFPDSPLDFLRAYVSGWRTSGLGGEGPAPPAFALLGAAGLLLGGAMDLLQKIVVLGAIPVGIFGAYRLASPVGSWRARVVAGVLYAAVPLPYDALAGGRWSGLIAYAAAPWLLARLLRATGLAPFGAPAAVEREAPLRRVAGLRPAPDGPAEGEMAGAGAALAGDDSVLGAEGGIIDTIASEELRLAEAALGGRHHEGLHHGPGGARRRAAAPAVPAGVSRPGSLAHQALAAGVLLGLVGAFVPSLVVAVVLVGAALVASGALLGDLRPMARALGVGGGAALVAGTLLLPWTLELVLPGATWAGFAGLGPPAPAAPGLADLLRFTAGPVGGGPAGWGILVAAGLPLVMGRRWRFSWAARLWLVAVVLWAVTWALGRGWLALPPPPPDVLLAPAAAAIVLAAVLGLAAFETDLPGYQFGVRQVAFLVAAVAAVTTTLPVLGAAFDGRWKLPRGDFAALVSWMPERQSEGAFRVLWAGSPEVLPLAGWHLDTGLAYGTSRGGPADATVLWPASDHGPTGLVADALGVARRGETSRLGHLLAPMGIRYVAVPLDVAPAPPGRPGGRRREPPDLLAALRGQIDLKLITGGPGDSLIVYENAAWAPARSVLPPEAVPASRESGLDAARTTELAGAPPALTQRSPTRFTGPWPGGELFFSEAYSPRWRFTVGSAGAEHRKAFGWANAYGAGAGEGASLTYRTSPLHYAGIALQLGLWIAAIRALVRATRARRASAAAAGA